MGQSSVVLSAVLYCILYFCRGAPTHEFPLVVTWPFISLSLSIASPLLDLLVIVYVLILRLSSMVAFAMLADHFVGCARLFPVHQILLLLGRVHLIG